MNTRQSGQKLIGILYAAVLLFAAVFLLQGATAAKVQAATKTGFVTEGKYTYYYDANGKVHKGWLKLGNKTYYFTSGKGVMVTGWVTDSKGNRRYFKKTGVMATGWTRFSGGKRYFDPSTGVMKKGWLKVGTNRYYLNKSNGFALSGFQKISGKYRYFYSNSCALARGWLTNSKGEKRFFKTASSAASDGVMSTGFTEVSGDTYYFYTNSGKMATGWVTNSETSKKYYFDTNTGKMVTGTVTIDGTTYIFNSDGTLKGTQESGNISTTGTKTIKNYLLGALQPVGKALYVWGGGWNDSTRKGISPEWVSWYNSQSSGYDYHYYNDLSTTNRAKGLDCSGFVGWATYQVMHTESNVGYGYTVVSGEVGGSYKARGWGNIINQAYLSEHNYVLKPGDIGYNDGHVWIVIGQCADKSVVIVHSTPQAGCQIAGTNTPDGGYDSQAAALARKYMNKFNYSSKYEYHNSAGNYIMRYNYFRWNRDTLADPDGYMSMTADQILADMLGE
jgi:hypothetical protein